MQSKLKLIIVFKHDVSEEEAEKLIQSFNVKYNEGMDSSRGKIYYLSTGPKYTLTFENEDQKDEFRYKRYQFRSDIHEIYEPDYSKSKD